MAALLALLSALGGAVQLHAQAEPPEAIRARDEYGPLFKDSRAQLALELARGRTDVRLLIASNTGRNADIASAAERIGGRVEYREDAVDYLRVRVPIGSVQELVTHDAISAVGLSMRTADLQVLLLSADGGQAGSTAGIASEPVNPRRDTLPEAWPPPRSDLPLRYPYSPLADLDAAGFGTPETPFDGRGVTAALIDGLPDMLLPELRWSATLHGQPTRKIVDILNATDPMDPVDDRHTPQWVEMRDRVVATERSLEHGGVLYTTPRDGAFRIGLLNERLFAPPMLGFGIVGGDLNRDGNPAGSDSLFAVLWDPESGEVWVDTQQDHSFAGEVGMLDYGIRHDVGIFGEDDPSTDVRESVGFTIQTDSTRGFVSINVGVGLHGTMTASALAASRRGGGAFDGVAPGTSLVIVDRGRTLHGEIEAVITGFQHPATELVVLEQGIRPPYLLRDGRSTASMIYDRLVVLYDKPLLIPSGNQPGLTTVAPQAEGRRALAVNAYQSAESFFINNGVRVAQRDNLHGPHSHGPGGDGRLKPDILAPSNIISLQPGFIPGGSRNGLYQFPPGYWIGGGTSTAAPVAAGALARLIGAAKQSGVPYDTERLVRAISRSARFIPSIAAHKQGNGLVQVNAAWELLRDPEFASESLRIVSRAPVRTVLSPLLVTPDEGQGIFEREGWSKGDTAVRTLYLTRLRGPSGPVRFNIRWLGNDSGAFAAAESVLLPLNKKVAFPVTIAPPATGVHSAILNWEDATGRVMHRTLNTIVVADTFEPEAGYTIRRSVMLPRPGTRSFFLRVPPGAAVLTVEVTGAGGGWDLWLYPPDARAQLVFAPSSPHRQRSVSHPAAGVWEVLVIDNRDDWYFDDSRPDPLPPTPITVEARLLGADIVAGGAMNAGRSSGNDYAALNITVQNRYGAFVGGLRTTPLGTALTERREIRRGEQQVSSIDVPVGTTMLRVHAERSTDPADLDLYLFDCTGDTCMPRKSATEAFDEPVVVADPAAGEWKVVVDASAVAAAGILYDYMDVIIHPSFGTFAISDYVRHRGPGAEWRAAGHVWLACYPPAGRIPYVSVAVQGQGIEGQVRISPTDPMRHVTEALEIGAAEALLRLGRRALDVRDCVV